MIEIITLGEIMLRLSPPGYQRFIQASQFDITYGGSEANIAACLASFGHKTGYLTKLPNNIIADCAIANLKKSNVDCSMIVRGGKRMGTYFLENGVSIRPSNVVYDRADSAMAEAKVEDFDFEKSLKGIKWFHTSGITPVIGKETVNIVKKAMKVAKENGAVISFDLNYRGKLWTNEISKKQKMISELMEYVDVCFGNARDAALVLGYEDGEKDFINGDYSICVNKENMQNVIKKYNFKYLVSSLRNNISASDNEYSAVVSTDSDYYIGNKIMIHIVDRVGSGDAFASGFIHGLITGMSKEDALNFGIASATIKHTIPGDFNYASIEEVEKLANGDSSGRVQR